VLIISQVAPVESEAVGVRRIDLSSPVGFISFIAIAKVALAPELLSRQRIWPSTVPEMV
jgi:hypothetical protein